MSDTDSNINWQPGVLTSLLKILDNVNKFLLSDCFLVTGEYLSFNLQSSTATRPSFHEDRRPMKLCRAACFPPLSATAIRFFILPT